LNKFDNFRGRGRRGKNYRGKNKLFTDKKEIKNGLKGFGFF
jgi:hypothetical protein